jgi:hypothetical protein
MTLALTQVDPMESEYLHFVATVTEILEKCQARYAIGGSFASMVYGEPRFTIDVDITIHLTTAQVPCLIEEFEQREWYFPRDELDRAVKYGGEFNTIDSIGGYKVDFYTTKPEITPQQQRTLERRQLKSFGYKDRQAYFMSAEDVILYKLQWYKEGGSEKHLRDIAVMLTAQKAQIDYNYIDQHVDEVNAKDAWQEIKSAHIDKD